MFAQPDCGLLSGKLRLYSLKVNLQLRFIDVSMCLFCFLECFLIISKLVVDSRLLKRVREVK